MTDLKKVKVMPTIKAIGKSHAKTILRVKVTT